MKCWLCLVAYCLIGCVGSSGRPDVSAPSGIPYAQKVGVHPQTESIGDVSEDAARALSIPALDEVGLPDGWREARVSDGYAMVAGAPAGIVRLVERRGRTQLGQIIFVWSERREWTKRMAATRCAEWVNDSRKCAYVSPTPLNWTEVAARFEALGGWTLAAPCEANGKYWTDSGELQIARLRAARFESYSCNAPGIRDGGGPRRAARALYDYIASLLGQASPPPPA